jgi:hypothetical protein
VVPEKRLVIPAIAAVVMIVAGVFIASSWGLPKEMCALMAACGGLFVILLCAVDLEEQSKGSAAELGIQGLQLRGGRHVPLSEVHGFDVLREWRNCQEMWSRVSSVRAQLATGGYETICQCESQLEGEWIAALLSDALRQLADRSGVEPRHAEQSLAAESR